MLINQVEKNFQLSPKTNDGTTDLSLETARQVYSPEWLSSTTSMLRLDTILRVPLPDRDLFGIGAPGRRTGKDILVGFIGLDDGGIRLVLFCLVEYGLRIGLTPSGRV